VPGRKRCLALDVLGLVVAVVVLAASAHENTAGIALLGRVAAHAGTVSKALVDQGFKSSVVSYGATVGIDVQVVERNPADRGLVPQPKRWVVEQTLGILSFHRRLVRDYEHRLSSSASRVYWAMTDVMARRLTGTSTPSWRPAWPQPRTPAGTCWTRSTREQALTREAGQAQAQIDELTARLRELNEAFSDLQITRKTLISLAGHDDGQAAAEPAGPSPPLPDHPAYQQILTAFADLRRPLRARDLCVALDLPIVSKNTENIRSKLKRLVSRGILVETEPGLFAQPHP
jgi:transposase